jgi:two-component system sensor histidine kinase FlrB
MVQHSRSSIESNQSDTIAPGFVERISTAEAGESVGDSNIASIHDGSSKLVSELSKSPESALSLFEQLSSELAHSYRNLEQRVGELKTELYETASNKLQQEKEKKALENRHSALLEVLPAGVVVLDGLGYVSDVNPAAIELLGEPLEGVKWLDIIKRCFAPKHDDGHEVSLKDGRRVRIETRSLKSGDGQLILLSDLTETRLLQEEVSRAERLSSLGKMVASLAHQIRTPLSTAMLYAGHLRRAEVDDEIRIDCAEKLLTRLTHLEHQIRDMLVFARGDTRLAEEVEVSVFFENLKQAAAPLLDRHEVKSTWDNKSKGRILCNQETLVGACMNLINNSIEAYESKQSSKSKLSISIRAVDSESRYVCLQVSDNGPGIPNQIEKRIVEPFFTTKSQGTGLGLAVVQAVAKAHNGKFAIRSAKHGTTATILLPLYEPGKIRTEIPRANEVKL